MQTLFLACFICLQLTYPSPDYNQSVSQKRDSSCHQCLNALLDPSLLAPGTEAQQNQTIGEFLASNHALQEVVQERLMQELSKRSTKTKNERTEEPQPQINQEEFATLVTEGEYAFEEIAPSKPKLEPIKLPKGLNDLRGLYETYVSPSKSEILKGPGNILKNGARLMGGEWLVSENGRFRATFQNNALLIITDQKKDHEIIKELGNPRSWKAGPKVYLIMQSDGNLVIYSEPEDGHAKYPSWESQTMTDYPDVGNTYYLKLENTGQLVIYDESSDYIVWHSGRRKSKWDHDICCL